MAEVKMPKLGESVTEGTLGQWLKEIGDPVQKYEPLVEVVTDKVTAEIPSDWDGVLTEILVKENETVQVGTPIARIAVADDETAPPTSFTAKTDNSPNETIGQAGTVADSHATLSQDKLATDVTQHALRVPGSRARYSPAVRKIAAERGIDLVGVKGSGLGGRVTRKDVLAIVPSSVDPAVTASPRRSVPAAADVGLAPTGEPTSAVTRVPVTPVRRMIAARMSDSKREIPHAWMMVEVDVTPIVRLREKHKREFKEREGVDLTFFPFFMQAVADGLKAFPMVNSTWADDEIIVHKDIHLSIAVATEDALVVPVVHHADRLSILGLAAAVADLAKRARSGKLTVDDVRGGTFTVNNTGAFGSILSQPIINAPQAAILSVESIVRRPVVRHDDSIAIRSMVNLCLSLDHRILDGLVVGRFMRLIKERLESTDERMNLY